MKTAQTEALKTILDLPLEKNYNNGGDENGLFGVEEK